MGDSVMLGAAGALKQAIDGVEVNAEVSRQISAIITMLRQRRAAGQLSSVVVIHTGDNSYISAKQFDEMMQLLIDVPRVVIVNLKVPRRWEAPNNQIIADGVSRYSNAVLVDWHSASVDRPDLFGKDGIHLRPEGARLFAELVAIQARAPETRRGRFEP